MSYKYTSEQNNKNHFVIYYLEEMCQFINDKIVWVKYTASLNSEIVRVRYTNSSIKVINVTGDSLRSLAADVLKQI